MPKRKSLPSLEQTNGKIENVETKTPKTTLAQIWGETGNESYATNNQEEYEKWLAELNMTDLQKHATEHNVMPISNRERLTKNLISEFLAHWGKYKQINSSIAASKPLSKKALQVLSEGR